LHCSGVARKNTLTGPADEAKAANGPATVS